MYTAFRRCARNSHQMAVRFASYRQRIARHTGDRNPHDISVRTNLCIVDPSSQELRARHGDYVICRHLLLL